MAEKFMQTAVKRPGALTEKANRAGESPTEFAREHKHSSGLTGQQSRLALTFNKYRPGKRSKGRSEGSR